MRSQEPAKKDGPRINEEIRVREVHLILQDGTNKGTVSIAEALAASQEAGLDLVEISPNAAPPIVKILDYGKYKYQEQKKAAEARKKQKVVEVKELKYRPMIDDHDYDVKMRAMERFFEEGDKVKITLRFRGREMAHQELGTKLLNRVKEDTSKMAKVEMEPRFEGRQMIMILAPRRMTWRYNPTSQILHDARDNVAGVLHGRPDNGAAKSWNLESRAAAAPAAAYRRRRQSRCPTADWMTG